MPDPMPIEEKEKIVEPVRPNVVPSKEEEIASQTPNGVVPSEPEHELSPRELIYKKHDDLHRPSEPAVTPPAEPVEQVPNEPVALAPEGEPPAEPQRQKPGPKAQVEVTVNGSTRKVDKAKVDAAGGVEAYQMMVAGQEKLRLISQRQKELDDREAALELREKEPRPLAAPAEEPIVPSPDLATPVEDQVAELRLKANNALLDGEVEESAKLNASADSLLRKSATQDAIQHVEQNQLQRDEARRVQREKDAAKQRAADIETGTAHFAIEFPEIMADAQLLQLADSQTITISQENPDWTPTQVMQQAGKNVHKWLSDQGATGEPPAEPPANGNPKALEKRSMRSPQSGSARSPRKPAPKQSTPSDYVQSLKERRGQA